METEFGAPTSLEDFERKAQMLDYAAPSRHLRGVCRSPVGAELGPHDLDDATRVAQMEWNFLSSDYDTQSSFYGTQKACEPVHAQLNLTDSSVDLINLGRGTRPLKVRTRVEGLDGKTI